MPKPKQKRFRFKRMGGINSVAEEGALLPFGAGGATLQELQRNPDMPLEFRDIENWIPLRRGGKSTNFGFTIHKAIGVGTVTGMFRFITSDNTSRFMVTHAQNLYTMADNGDLTEVGTDEISNGAFVDFQVAYDNLVVCDGTQAPKIYDGSSISNMGGSPPGEARQSIFLRDRLFVFGDASNPSLLYYSDVGDIESGYSNNLINCDVNDGQAITCIFPLFLPVQLDPVIVVGKERSVGIVTGSGTATDPFTFYKANKDAGAPGFRSMVQFGQDMAYLTQVGVKSYKTDLVDVNLQHRDLTEEVEDKFRELDRESLGNSIAWDDPDNTRICFAVPEEGSTYANVIWEWDTRTHGWTKQRFGNLDITSVMVDTDGTWYHGDSQGDIYKHLKTTKNYNGVAINSFLKTDYMDFFEPSLLKRILEARITLRGDGEYNLGVGIKLDNGTRVAPTHQLPITSPSYIWGGGVWTDDPEVYQWGAAPIDIRRFIPSGYFRNIEFNFGITATDQPVDLFDFDILVEYMERR